MNARLELALITRIGEQLSNRTYKSERHFLDFIIDGQSLWERCGKSRDAVSVLCVEFEFDETTKSVDRLLLREYSDLPSDRHKLFICAECGEIGCGAVTLRVEKNGATVAWKDFGYENNYEEGIHLDDYRHIGPFVFDADQYQNQLLLGIEEIKRLRETVNERGEEKGPKP